MKQFNQQILNSYKSAIKNNIEYKDVLIEISEGQLEQLSLYLNLLLEWTSRVDLISEKDPEKIIQRHFIDSIIAGQLFIKESLPNLGVLDIGTGAGFPGMIMAIINPHIKFYLCEPRDKRVVFLKEVVRRLDLKNSFAIQKRIQEIANSELMVDAVISRALVVDRDIISHISKYKYLGLVQGKKSNKIKELNLLSELSYKVSPESLVSFIRIYSL